MNASILFEDHRLALARLGDAIVPRHASMPSAGELGLAAPGGPVDDVLRRRPDLAAAVAGVLAGAGAANEPAAFLEDLEATAPAAMEALLELVLGAYYLHPEVRRLIGYPGQEAQSLDRGAIGAEEELMAMMEAPPRWRAVPEDGSQGDGPQDNAPQDNSPRGNGPEGLPEQAP